MPIPSQYLRSAQAPAARTLLDILRTTADTYPDAPAIDDGHGVITYSELLQEVLTTAEWLTTRGIRRGDRIGIRMPSGERNLYIAILSTLAAGAAYVPVDADDPDERAALVFGEAEVQAIYTADGLCFTEHTRSDRTDDTGPTLDCDAWIIFTSGSTGTPKGVAVSHRSAAAFVDAEAHMFLQEDLLGPEDRVLAGLSVAFDASCEEMWLAWRHGACLVPAPRSLVRSGVDLGPWLISKSVTVVSTVPTLASLWPDEALDAVRLLIFGGEACPPELAARLSNGSRELWNTYGPTEATVVACGTTMDGIKPVSIGLPLAGWDLAVVDSDNQPVAMGETGELIIGGVGLARYLDPQKDAEKFAPMPELGWGRAYRSGDHVRLEEDGLYFVGRVDDQVKIGGRRIELGEVDACLSRLSNVRSSSVVVQTTGGGDKVLVGYISPEHGTADDFDIETARAQLQEDLPSAMVPRLCAVDSLPVTTSGKVDKRALPWPLPSRGESHFDTPTQSWIAELFSDALGTTVLGPDVDFFSLGGTSLAAATLVARVRERVPEISVRDLYDHSRLGAFAEYIDSCRGGTSAIANNAAMQPELPGITPVSATTRVVQALIQIPAMTLAGAQWVAWLLVANWLLSASGVEIVAGFAPVDLGRLSWLWAALALLIFATPLGRLPLSAILIRAVTAGITEGNYPRGGAVHLRIWAAERIADTCGARDISGATWITTYARWLGADVGTDVQLHTLPPVTGLLTLADQCSVEPEVDLSGYWIERDRLHVGRIDIGKGASIGARSTVLPGARIGSKASVEAGSAVRGEKKVKSGSRWAGSPAVKVGKVRSRWPSEAPARRPLWIAVYGLSSLLLSLLPLIAIGSAAAFVAWGISTLSPDVTSFLSILLTSIAWALPGGLIGFAIYTALTWISVRILSIGIKPGVVPVRSATGWRIWAIERLMDAARTYLFPMYAAQLTPLWFRSLGARIGKDAEISTAVMVPAFAEVKAGAFLADDTMVGGYELGGGGWMLSGHTRVGKRSFLGNSGIAGPSRTLKKNSLVAVLSSTPKKTKAGSNWIGSPPERLRRVEVEAEGDSRTYNPTFALKCARGLVETLRLLAPMVSAAIMAGVLVALQWILMHWGPWAVFCLSGFVLIAAGFVAAAITVCMKWLCVQRITPGDHVLWSWFVWLNELQDQFVETVAGPWFLAHTLGTGSLNVFLRALGATVGTGAWLDTYWLPEADLVTIGRGATVGPGCVVQTHLFQDRVMSLDTVTLDEGSTLGPHSVALPASRLAKDATVGPASLVMRGDHVPPSSRWQGNPIEIWT
ncbi:Pls/PosA family non-ribosomal peptide synthetase [Corynebacterium anserum]|uniref:Amino acid adenylation domain-containing protein n=1 Tax=Corynebacterium anserum TaxID=2684406 RepID=A0A7G7YM01_9CORY|nr:Pls/PosA family non-ribosomal peptide synthetase [Corynebacterium anserum]QNH95521.1 amino acid adenylation domain-containing protein [Corynebacterium anserum]